MTLTRRWAHVATLALILFILSCVTINVYFPAAEVEAVAEEIVKDVYSAGDAAPSPSSMLLPRLRQLFGVGVAYADVNINVTTPAIRALRDALKGRSPRLAPFYGAGTIGINNAGHVVTRDVSGLTLKAKADLKKLLTAENADRARLYREIVAANDLGLDDVAQVERIFAAHWREHARPGWWFQTDAGEWAQKK